MSDIRAVRPHRLAIVPHLRYLKYVLLHKWYVYHAGMLIARVRGEHRWRMFWRLVFHDMSKFSRAEWSPYVWAFYADKVPDRDERRIGRKVRHGRTLLYDFNVAWLHHQHVNDHHWQYWLLREDSGSLIQLLPPAYVIDEMVADWCGAGSKILSMPHLAQCIAETVAWYTKNYAIFQLRSQARQRVEEDLAMLCHHFGIIDAAKEVLSQQSRRVSITMPLGGTQRAPT